jgi:hypothetical protein
MKRIGIRIAATVSAIVCVAALALCVRSFMIFDHVYVPYELIDTDRVGGGSSITLSSQRGLAGITYTRNVIPRTVARSSEERAARRRQPRPISHVTQHPHHGVDHMWRTLGFGTGGDGLRHAADSGYFGVWFPYWLMVLLFGILPTIALRRWIATRRTLLVGTCPDCGYDLRATPGRCPECGTDVSTKLGGQTTAKAVRPDSKQGA